MIKKIQSIAHSKTLCVEAFAIFVFMSVFIAKHYGDDTKSQSDAAINEYKAFRLALDQAEKASFLSGVASYRVSAKFTERDGWNFRFVILPESPDNEMSVFVKPDGTVRAGR